jgi:hypothetical protein
MSKLAVLRAAGALSAGVLLLASATSAATLLSVDVNDRQSTDPTDTAPGFSSYKMSGTSAASSTTESQAVGAYTVSLLAFDDHQDENTVTAGVQDTVGQIDDRDRAVPVDGGALTYGQLYDDVIFATPSVGPTGGMNLTISGGALLPNTQYSISIYAYDSGSTAAPQPRSANWLDGNNADALVTATTFNGATLPTTNSQYQFTGLAVTDANGVLLLKGRNTSPNASTGPTTIGVFLNGFEINTVPEPTSASLLVGAAAVLGMARSRRRRAI